MTRLLTLCFVLLIAAPALAEETDDGLLRAGPLRIEVELAGVDPELVPEDYADADYVDESADAEATAAVHAGLEALTVPQ